MWNWKRGLRTNLALALFGAALLVAVSRGLAADHGDAPFVSDDQGTDIGDVYFFLDPNDNNFAVLAMDVHGFIVPSENQNLGKFDPGVRFHFAIENTGDAIPDVAINVSFSRQTSRTTPQTATIVLPDGRTFTAPTTISSATTYEPSGNTCPPAPRVPVDTAVVTTDGVSGVSFFAGLRDDPFFFDIPAELKYRASRFKNAIDPSFFIRQRDSFAGYNIMTVALRVPKSLIQGNSSIVGLEGSTQMRMPAQKTDVWVNVDRMGIPAINTIFVGSRPAPGVNAPGCAALDPREPGLLKKDRYNFSTPQDDANGVFADDIVKNLQCLRANSSSITFFANAAVNFGDYLRLDLNKPNTGTPANTAGLGVPTTPGTFPPGGFADLNSFHGAQVPNGRRPGDDVMDVIITGINNFSPIGSPATCALTPAAFCVDGIDKNDRDFLSTFPFLAPPQQPLPDIGDTDCTKN